MEIDESLVKDENIDTPEISYEEKLRFVNAISVPMAPKKLTKKIYKCIKKGELLQSPNYSILFTIIYFYYYLIIVLCLRDIYICICVVYFIIYKIIFSSIIFLDCIRCIC